MALTGEGGKDKSAQLNGEWGGGIATPLEVEAGGSIKLHIGGKWGKGESEKEREMNSRGIFSLLFSAPSLVSFFLFSHVDFYCLWIHFSPH